MNTSLTGEETHSLGSHEVQDVSNAAASPSVPITSDKSHGRVKLLPIP